MDSFFTEISAAGGKSISSPSLSKGITSAAIGSIATTSTVALGTLTVVLSLALGEGTEFVITVVVSTPAVLDSLALGPTN